MSKTQKNNKEEQEPLKPNKNEEKENINNNLYSNLNDISSFKLNPELKDLQKEVLHYGGDIIDEEDMSKYEDRPSIEKVAHKFYKIYEIIEHYVFAFLSIAFAVYIIYYTNLFYNLYFNPRVNKIVSYISAFLFIIDILIFMYICCYLPLIKKIDDKNVDKMLDDIAPYCTIIGLFAFLFLILSIWELYRWYSILIVMVIFWGIIMSGNIAQQGIIGNVFFVFIIISMLFSYKFIKGEGTTFY